LEAMTRAMGSAVADSARAATEVFGRVPVVPEAPEEQVFEAPLMWVVPDPTDDFLGETPDERVVWGAPPALLDAMEPIEGLNGEHEPWLS
jgi:hypothetical protein